MFINADNDDWPMMCGRTRRDVERAKGKHFLLFEVLITFRMATPTLKNVLESNKIVGKNKVKQSERRWRKESVYTLS